MLKIPIAADILYQSARSHPARCPDWAVRTYHKAEAMQLGRLRDIRPGMLVASPENRYYGELAQEIVLSWMERSGITVIRNEKPEYIHTLCTDGGYDAEVVTTLGHRFRLDVKAVSCRCSVDERFMRDDWGFYRPLHQLCANEPEPVLMLLCRLCLMPAGTFLCIVGMLWSDEFMAHLPQIFTRGDYFPYARPGWTVDGEPLFYLPYNQTVSVCGLYDILREADERAVRPVLSFDGQTHRWLKSFRSRTS